MSNHLPRLKGEMHFNTVAWTQTSLSSATFFRNDRPEQLPKEFANLNRDWDAKKASSNVRKHGVSFPEAGTVFGDPMALTFDDPDHSIGERRFLTFGVTRTNKFLIVCHTEEAGVTRIISAREMNKQERKIYEEG